MFKKNIIIIGIMLFCVLSCDKKKKDDPPSSTTTKTSGIEWFKAVTTSSPSSRGGGSAIFDSANNRMIIFGGTDIAIFYNDSWEFKYSSDENGAWLKLLPTGSSPSVRSSHIMIIDTTSSRAIVFGGYDNSSFLNDVWTFSLSDQNNINWTKLNPSGTPPSGRRECIGTFDPDNNRMIVFGGYDGTNYLNEAWELNFTSGSNGQWNKLSPQGSSPNARGLSCGIYDPSSKSLIIFGGKDTSQAFDESWQFLLTSSQGEWIKLQTTNSPSARYGSSAVRDTLDGKMIVYGGFSSSNLNELWQLDVQTKAWAKIVPEGSNSPSSRREHMSIYHSGKSSMNIFGGFGTFSTDVWRLKLH
jgi:hypothetical protein